MPPVSLPKKSLPLPLIKLLTLLLRREIAYRAGFLEKYPYAYATYDNAVNHQEHVESLLRGASDRVKDHKRYIRDLARRGADT